jgi:ribosomal protein L33
MNEEIHTRVHFECPNCKEENYLNFDAVEWNITRDQCGDVSGVYLCLKCSNCEKEFYSETNEGA